MKRSVVFFIVATVLIFGFQNCGTDTGNPYSSISLSQTGLLYTESLANRLCAVLQRCQGVVPSDCVAGIKPLVGLGGRFGGGTFSTLNSLASEEFAQTNPPNLVSGNSCLTAISVLSCSDPNVAAAYVPNSSAPYSGVNAMVPAASSCETIYRH